MCFVRWIQTTAWLVWALRPRLSASAATPARSPSVKKVRFRWSVPMMPAIGSPPACQPDASSSRQKWATCSWSSSRPVRNRALIRSRAAAGDGLASGLPDCWAGRLCRSSTAVADLHRQVTGASVLLVGAADQQQGAAAAVAAPVDGQPRTHDHRRAGLHRVLGGVLGDLGVLIGERPQVDRAGQPRQHVLHPADELAAVGEVLLLRLAAAAHPIARGSFGELNRGVVVVLHLDRAADRRVGVEQHDLPGRVHGAQPRCIATMPPVRFFHWTPRQPTSRIIAASVGWSGQAMIDSVR